MGRRQLEEDRAFRVGGERLFRRRESAVALRVRVEDGRVLCDGSGLRLLDGPSSVVTAASGDVDTARRSE